MRKLFLLLLISLAAALTPPILPAGYYGYLHTSCSLTNPKLQAVVGGEVRAEVELVKISSGLYAFGGPGRQTSTLLVSLTEEENGGTVKFRVCDNGQCFDVGEDNLISDAWKELNLTLTTCPTVATGAGVEEGVGGGGGGALPPPQEQKEEENKITVPKEIVEEVVEGHVEINKPTRTLEIKVPERKEANRPEKPIVAVEKIKVVTKRPVSGHSHARIIILKRRPPKIKPPRKAKVIKYLDVSVDEKTKKLAQTLRISFKVKKTAVTNPLNVRLAHYLENEWKLEPTFYVGEENDYYKFEARVSTLSYFAVVEIKEEAPREERREEITLPQPPQQKVQPPQVLKEEVKVTKKELPLHYLLVLLVALVIILFILGRRKKKVIVEL